MSVYVVKVRYNSVCNCGNMDKADGHGEKSILRMIKMCLNNHDSFHENDNLSRTEELNYFSRSLCLYKALHHRLIE